MNTLRNLAALAFLGFATFSPAHAAETAAADTETGSSDVRQLLEDQPEIAALVRASKDKAIANALKEQLDKAGGEKAIAEALNGYLGDQSLKEGQDISDLARNAKERAVAEALKARFSKNP